MPEKALETMDSLSKFSGPHFRRGQIVDADGTARNLARRQLRIEGE
jgi:hypothetical protein